ncbi:MAG: DinB family protein [Phycisphaerales bacterium]
MNATALIDRLGRMQSAFPALLAGVPDDEARWKPASGAWSILEIARHMLDEEILDFRTRVRLTLQDPELPWPPTDPQGWAQEKRYNQDDLKTTARQFAREREQSVAWLRSLRNPEWSRAHVHPRFGPLHAGMLLTCWAAHDALHVRQIAKRLFELSARDGAGYSTAYAGEWGA